MASRGKQLHERFSFDPLARNFVVARNVQLERRLLQERALAMQQMGPAAEMHAGKRAYAASNRFSNNHKVYLPGGQLYYHSGINPHRLARITRTDQMQPY